MRDNILLIWDRALAKRTRRLNARLWIATNRETLQLDPTPPITAHKSYSDTIVVSAHQDGQPVIVKIAPHRQAAQSLRKHIEVTQWLRQRLTPELRHLIPRTLHTAKIGSRFVLVESALPGTAGQRSIATNKPKEIAFECLRAIHNATSVVEKASPADLTTLITHPISILRAQSPRDLLPSLDLLAQRLQEALSVEPLLLSCTHGDFFPPNVLFSNANFGAPVQGIIDWETGHRRGLPETDIVGWELLTASEGRTQLTVRLLSNEAELARTFEHVGRSPSHITGGHETLLLLTWLGQVASTAERIDFGPAQRAWFRTEVEPVLELLARSESPG